MPQMSPMLWMPLFFFFTLMIYMLMSYIYFEPIKKMNKANMVKPLYTNNWKW